VIFGKNSITLTIINLKNFKTMKKNMGSSDKIIRVIIAIVIAALYWQGIIPGTVGIVLLALALIFVLTSLVSFCPLYLPLGINTCKKK
jgi:hypothetical protein